MDKCFKVKLCPNVGGNFWAVVHPDEAVSNFRGRVENALNLPNNSLVFVHRQRVLDSGIVGQHGITEGSNIFVTQNLKTGQIKTRRNHVLEALDRLSDFQLVTFLQGRNPLRLVVNVDGYQLNIAMRVYINPCKRKTPLDAHAAATQPPHAACREPPHKLRRTGPPETSPEAATPPAAAATPQLITTTPSHDSTKQAPDTKAPPTLHSPIKAQLGPLGMCSTLAHTQSRRALMLRRHLALQSRQRALQSLQLALQSRQAPLQSHQVPPHAHQPLQSPTQNHQLPPQPHKPLQQASEATQQPRELPFGTEVQECSCSSCFLAKSIRKQKEALTQPCDPPPPPMGFARYQTSTRKLEDLKKKLLEEIDALEHQLDQTNTKQRLFDSHAQGAFFTRAGHGVAGRFAGVIDRNYWEALKPAWGQCRGYSTILRMFKELLMAPNFVGHITQQQAVNKEGKVPTPDPSMTAESTNLRQKVADLKARMRESRLKKIAKRRLGAAATGASESNHVHSTTPDPQPSSGDPEQDPGVEEEWVVEPRAPTPDSTVLERPRGSLLI